MFADELLRLPFQNTDVEDMPDRLGAGVRTKGGNLMNCGTTDHPPECLCDVDLGAAAQRHGCERVSPIRFGTHEVLNASRVAERLGLGVPWTGEAFVELYRAHVDNHDRCAAIRAKDRTRHSYVVADRVKHMLRQGCSIAAAALTLGMVPQEALRALTNGSPTNMEGWTEQVWEENEAFIRSEFPKHTRDHLSKRLRVNWATIDSLADWYGVEYNTDNESTKATALVKRLLSEGWHPGDVTAEAQRSGLPANSASVYKMRQRMVDRGELTAELPERREPA